MLLSILSHGDGLGIHAQSSLALGVLPEGQLGRRWTCPKPNLESGPGAELGFKKNPKYFPVLVASPGLGLSNKVRHIS